MQLTIGCGFNTIPLLTSSYPDRGQLDPQHPEYYNIVKYRQNRALFYSRLYNILSNEPFNNCDLFNKVRNIGKGPSILEYSPAMREGLNEEPFSDTVKRIILGFEGIQKLPLHCSSSTPIWNDNIYYKMNDEELKNYFIELLNIYPKPIQNPILELKEKSEESPNLFKFDPIHQLFSKFSEKINISSNDKNISREDILNATMKRNTIKEGVKKFKQNYTKIREDIKQKEIIDGWRN